MFREVQVGFYNLINSCTTTTFNTIAPQSTSLPYITFGVLTETPIGDFGDFEAVENFTYWVNCFSSKSVAQVCSLADEVMGNLDDANLTVSGYTTMKCVREFTGNILWDFENGVFQIPLRYRILLSKA